MVCHLLGYKAGGNTDFGEHDRVFGLARVALNFTKYGSQWCVDCWNECAQFIYSLPKFFIV